MNIFLDTYTIVNRKYHTPGDSFIYDIQQFSTKKNLYDLLRGNLNTPYV